MKTDRRGREEAGPTRPRPPLMDVKCPARAFLANNRTRPRHTVFGVYQSPKKRSVFFLLILNTRRRRGFRFVFFSVLSKIVRFILFFGCRWPGRKIREFFFFVSVLSLRPSQPSFINEKKKTMYFKLYNLIKNKFISDGYHINITYIIDRNFPCSLVTFLYCFQYRTDEYDPPKTQF